MYYLIISLFCIFSLHSVEPSDQKIKTIYASLDPTSLAQHLSFYELYRNRPIGQQALKDAWQILAGKQIALSQHGQSIPFSVSVIDALIALVNKQNSQLPVLDDNDLIEIEKFSKRLNHNKIKGHSALTEEEVIQLNPDDIDLARGLFLSEMGPDVRRIRTYEALLDIMALQILARLPDNADPAEKIRQINTLIFDEMGFRFPPKSIHCQDIDLYSHLPSVLDSHRGVCLGVSVVYICIAQRLGLKMEMITPPGHIYVRYCDANQIINVETTARGIHLDSEHYLGIDTHSLQQRNVKEVIGLVHFNQAAVYWQQEDHEKARQAYLRAEPYLKHDCLLKELMGYTCLLSGRKEEGERLLWEVKDYVPDYAITKSTAAEDYFNGHADAESIKLIFARTEDQRSALVAQKNTLEAALKKFPLFRNGIIQLAMTWIKLHRYGEALEVLKKYDAIQSDDPEVNYYLAVLYEMRSDYPNAWHHLRQAEKIVHSKNHYPKTLKEFRRELLEECPE